MALYYQTADLSLNSVGLGCTTTGALVQPIPKVTWPKVPVGTSRQNKNVGGPFVLLSEAYILIHRSEEREMLFGPKMKILIFFCFPGFSGSKIGQEPRPDLARSFGIIFKSKNRNLNIFL